MTFGGVLHEPTQVFRKFSARVQVYPRKLFTYSNAFKSSLHEDEAAEKQSSDAITFCISYSAWHLHGMRGLCSMA